MSEIDVTILGAGGETGQKLVELLELHPNVVSLNLPSHEELAESEVEGSDVVISALPNGESAPLVAEFRDQGCTVIDMSGDLRFPTVELYEEWYGKEHPKPELLSEHTPYGLPELYRHRLEPGRKLVSMPGCYATDIVLALAPLDERDMIEPGSVTTVSAGSGYSGRGKKADNSDILNADGTGRSVKQYKPGRMHQHVGEVEQVLSGQTILFKPEVLPVAEGILAKSTVRLASGVSPEDVADAFQEAYTDEPFVKVLSDGQPLETAYTATSHLCYISFVALKDTVFITSGLNNLFKGASSQTVQVFNLINGLPETTGLKPKA